MKKTLILGLVAGLALTAPNTAVADEWEDQVRMQLGAMEAMLEAEGYTRWGSYTFDTMTESEVDDFTMTLQRGTSYTFIGACDMDCADIDYWLYDENDNEVDRDVSDDDVPVVEVTPDWTGEFRIKVRMYDCSKEPCTHGILVMQEK